MPLGVVGTEEVEVEEGFSAVFVPVVAGAGAVAGAVVGAVVDVEVKIFDATADPAHIAQAPIVEVAVDC